jgi:hypothetical protein
MPSSLPIQQLFNAVSVATNAALETQETLNFPVDYNDPTAADPVSGMVFCRQSEITDWLTAHGTSNFKHLVSVWGAIPSIIAHTVNINLAAGVHRPKGPQPPDIYAQPSWPLSGKICIDNGYVVLNGAAPSTFTAIDPSLTSLTITSMQVGSNDPWMEFAGTPFTGFDIDGYFALLDTGQVVLIHKHTTNRIYVVNGLSPAPTSVIKIAKPSTILRGSLDDVAQYGFVCLEMRIAQQNSGYYTWTTLNNILVEPFGGRFSNFYSGMYWLNNVIYDIPPSMPGSNGGPSFRDPITFGYLSNVSVRSNLTNCYIGLSITSGATLQLFGAYIKGGYYGAVYSWGGYFSMFDTVIVQGGAIDEVDCAGILLERTSIDGGTSSKTPEIRDQLAGVPGIQFVDSYMRRDIRTEVIFSNCQGPCVRAWSDGRVINNAPSSWAGLGFTNGGGNTDVGIEFRGANNEVIIEASNTATGTLGDVRMADGTIISYTNIKALGPIIDPKGNYIEKV